jgi:hypothetical protein
VPALANAGKPGENLNRVLSFFCLTVARPAFTSSRCYNRLAYDYADRVVSAYGFTFGPRSHAFTETLDRRRTGSL